MFNNLDAIKAAGFVGFVSVAEFHSTNNYSLIPKKDGIYLILRLASTEPQFLAVNPSRIQSKHLKKPHLHAYPVERLESKAAKLKDSIVIYIGKAGGGSGSANLQERLKAYLEAGRSTAGSSSHAGGRAIWQLQDSPDLLACWKASTDEDAIDEEHRLLDEFKKRFNSLPLANWKR